MFKWNLSAQLGPAPSAGLILASTWGSLGAKLCFFPSFMTLIPVGIYLQSAISMVHAMTNKFRVLIGGILGIVLLCTNVGEVFDPWLLPVNPKLTSGHREEICQPVTNVVVRDSEGTVSGKKKKISLITSGPALFWSVECLNLLFGHRTLTSF